MVNSEKAVGSKITKRCAPEKKKIYAMNVCFTFLIFMSANLLRGCFTEK